MTTKDSSRFAEELRTGDVLLMDRACSSMRNPLGITLCLFAKTACNYDHVAMIMKLNEEDLKRFQEEGIIDSNDPHSSSGTYVLETNVNGVSVRSFENRLAKSSAKRFAIRNLCINDGRTEYEKKVLMEIEDLYKYSYKTELLGFIPSFVSTPDKMDRVKAAYKLRLLNGEVAKIDELLLTENSSLGNEVLQHLRKLYINGANFMTDVYFSHLNQAEGESDFPSLVWSEGNYFVDGCNAESEVFCSELVTRVWYLSGMLTGFPPLSSFRPFDFLGDTRFNFTSSDIFLGDVISVVKESPNALHITRKDENYPEKNNIQDRLRFFALACGIDTTDEELLNTFLTDKSSHVGLLKKWLVQSATSADVQRDFAFHCFTVGLLFAAGGLLCAPLRLCWLERQLGLALQRGSLWSLAAGGLARDLAFAAAQALACLAVSARAPAHAAVLGGPALTDTGLFDARHPYYYVCGVWLFANVVGHIVTTPVENSVLAHHFGPLRAGPTPMRTLMCGTLSLAPICAVLPYLAAWVTWYETIGSAIVPTPSSILRQRADLITSEEWKQKRFSAIAGACTATLAIDLAAYPFQTRCRRNFLGKLYRPFSPPSFGRKLFAGYSYRLTSNIIVMATTVVSLSSMSII